ncbi:MAG: methyltransferase domain-containing protein [Candidatus Omnitrophota bacterium]
MLKDQKCNLCGFDRQAMVYEAPDKKDAHSALVYSISESNIIPPKRIVRCKSCGLIYASPIQRWEDLYAAYSEMEDEAYIREEKGRRIAARSLLKKIGKIKKYSAGSKMLDVGCGTGFLLDEARKAGWDAHGVEISKWAANYADKELKLKVYNTTLNEKKFPDKNFDLIILQDVIEHLIDPKAVIKEARRILSNDGILYINTPDIESLPSRLLRARWWGINRFHLYYFSKKTLDTMLEAAGFKSIRYCSHARTFSSGYWLERFKSYSVLFYKVLFFVSRITFLEKRIITVNLYDQIGAFARKSRKLEYIHEFENEEKSYSEKEKKIIIVLPSYNAAKTLNVTFNDIPKGIADDIILVDDASRDNTKEIAAGLGIKVFSHKKNRGYGANQKTCFSKALESGADIVVMLHPDYQYDPRAIPELIAPIKSGRADAVFGSRMMKGGSLIGGMPLWKHNANILLTALENIVFNTYLTEYHSGFRAYSSQLLRKIHFKENSDGFVFDTEIIAQALLHRFRIEEIPIRTRYFDEASSIKFFPCLVYGLGILKTLLKYILHTRKIIRFRQFE